MECKNEGPYCEQCGDCLICYSGDECFYGGIHELPKEKVNTMNHLVIKDHRASGGTFEGSLNGNPIDPCAYAIESGVRTDDNYYPVAKLTFRTWDLDMDIYTEADIERVE